MGVRYLWCITVDSLLIKIYILQQKKKKTKGKTESKKGEVIKNWDQDGGQE